MASAIGVGACSFGTFACPAPGCEDGRVSPGILIDGLSGEPTALLIAGGRIVAVDGEARAASDARRVDGAGLRAVPGFIELQVNGLGDADVTSDPSALWRLAERLPRHGVTSFLPTVVSSPRGAVERALAALAAPPPRFHGAEPLGIHAEGPFIAEARHGAHDTSHLRDPDNAEIERWVAGGVRLMTLAPERRGAMDAISRIAAAGAVAAIGHTDADAATAVSAVDAGARYATHLFNAMPPLHHRAPGTVGVLLDDERVTLGLIADGVHVDAMVLRLVGRAAPGRISLVSDAVGDRLGDAAVQGGRRDDGTLAGGVDGLDHVVRTFAAVTGSLDTALEAVTVVPARLLGLDDGRGSLRPGGRADVVLLDAEARVAATLVAGEPAFCTDRLAWP